MYTIKIQVGRKNPACVDPPHVIVASATTAEEYARIRARVVRLLTGKNCAFAFRFGVQNGEKWVDPDCEFGVTITQVRNVLRDEFMNIYIPDNIVVQACLFRTGDAPYSFIRGGNVL